MKLAKLALVIITAVVVACSLSYPVQAVDLTATVALTVSDISVSSIGYYSATISWKTNGDATSQVFYDTASHDNVTGYAHQTSESLSLVLVHSIGLTGLSSGTTYHYRVRSRIPETDFIAVSNDYTFTTLTPSAPPTPTPRPMGA